MAKPTKILIPADISRSELRGIFIKNREVYGSYLDQTGKVRKFNGTLHPDITPAVEGQIGGNKRDRICYTDNDKKAFRTILMDNFRGGHYYQEAA